MENRTRITNSTSINSGSSSTYAIGVATLLLGIIGLIGNTIGLFDVYLQHKRNRQRSSATTLLFASSSFSALIFSGYIMILTGYTEIYAYNQIVATKNFEGFCKASAFIYFVLCAVCAFSHSSIALNRLLVVIFAARYPIVKSLKATLFLLGMSWFIPVIIFMYPLWDMFGIYGFSPANRCAFKKLNPDYLFSYKIIYYFIPFGIMVVCYSLIILFSWMSKKRVKRIDVKPTTTDQAEDKKKGRAKKRDLRLTKIAFITCVAFLICFIPNAIFGVAVKDLKVIQSDVGIGFNFWVWIGCALAPLVYTFLSSDMCSSVGRRFRVQNSASVANSTSNEPMKIPPLTISETVETSKKYDH